MSRESPVRTKPQDTKPRGEREERITEKTSRRRYSPPRVLSTEPLELAAATCENPAQGIGKLGVPGCVPPYGS
jgi:hypothetical protein